MVMVLECECKKKKGLWYEAWPISLCCAGNLKNHGGILRTSIWGWGGGGKLVRHKTLLILHFSKWVEVTPKLHRSTLATNLLFLNIFKSITSTYIFQKLCEKSRYAHECTLGVVE